MMQQYNIKINYMILYIYNKLQIMKNIKTWAISRKQKINTFSTNLKKLSNNPISNDTPAKKIQQLLNTKANASKDKIVKWMLWVKLVNKIRKLKGLSKQQWMLIAILGILCAYATYYFIKNYFLQAPKSTKKAPQRQNSKLNMIKKTGSLISLKQYQSHSNSGIQSDSEDYSKIKQVRKITKQYKQYCTDIDTDIQKQGTLDQKRDKFFFNLMGSYQVTKQGKQKKNQTEELEYECQYEQSQDISPHRGPVDNPKLLAQLDKTIIIIN